MDHIIETKKVCQTFPVASGKEFVALNDISIHIPKGKLTVLRGRSGSGKTTLMNILGTLDRPKSGSVFFEEQDIGKMKDSDCEQLRRREMGFVFQSVALIPMMSAYENTEFALRLQGVKGNYKERTKECLNLVGLGKRMRHLPQELSGGEQQRVAIARAIAHNPKVVFADEPTAELDTATGLQIVKVFRELVESEGITIILSTHDTGLMEVADCIYELEDGEII
ncbi:MAG: ABC transporter ATP-binding protein [Lachnoclostridium sp.]|jgi:putative ABC transport system ATP-binding protein|nr:ABC transporter ATP-binding protein [Lachnoclostridium sp.]